jgi:hypothetical protein
MQEHTHDAFSVAICPGEIGTSITMSADLFLRFLRRARESHALGLAGFG